MRRRSSGWLADLRHSAQNDVDSRRVAPAQRLRAVLPTRASWMNLVEVWFSLIERQAIHRGAFASVNELNAKIRAFIDGWNDRSHAFVWTKTAEDILEKANP